MAEDEVDVTIAEHALDKAQANLAGATLTAPVAGTVASIGVTTGSQASTSSGIVIVGSGAAVVTVDVPLTTLPRVSKGLAAAVTPAAATTSVAGTVSQIGLLPSSTTASTPTYPVQILVPKASQALSAGSRAEVSLVVERVTDVVTVPVSAVTTSSVTGATATGTVSVLAGGVVTSARVSTGAVGQGLVQVTSGLTAGQVVVLADTTAALPTSSSTTRTGLNGLTGLSGNGPGAGGPPAGGFGGGARRGN